SYYGILQAGGTVTQVNPMLLGKELAYILKDSGAETIVIYEPLIPVLNEIIEQTAIKHVIKVNLEGHDYQDGLAVPFTDFIKRAKIPPQPVAITPSEDIAVLQYTGGTTGRSKGVMITHRNVLANVMQSYEFFQDNAELGIDHCLTVIPLFPVFCMTSCINLSIYTGAMSILLPTFNLDGVLQTIKDMHPSSFPAVPTV